METKLTALRANLDMVKAVVCEEYKKFLDELTEFVTNDIVVPTGAHLCRISLRDGFRDNVEVTFELGFKTPEGKVDFGSDCWFEYNHKGLNINYGTIGSWTRENKYQVLRIKMLSYVCDRLVELETKFKELINKYSFYKEKKDEQWSIEREITTLENALKRQRASDMMNSVEIGNLMVYEENVHPTRRLFATNCFSKANDFWRVDKMGEKTVTLTSLSNQDTRRISKENILKDFQSGTLSVIK